MERIKNLSFKMFILVIATLTMIGILTLIRATKTEAYDDNMAHKQGYKVRDLQKIEVKQEITEAEKIDRWLESKGSPMSGVGSTCVAMAEQYQVPCDLVLGIAGAESGLGTQGYANGTNNAWGWGVHQGVTFDSWGWGVMKVGEGLKKYYFDYGLTDVWSIRPKYCPRGIDSNGYGNEWENRVLFYMEDLRNFEV